MNETIDLLWYILYAIILIDYFGILEINLEGREMGILSSLATKEKRTVSVLFDKDFDVKFQMQYLDKDELSAILAKHTKTVKNPKTREVDEKIDGPGMTEEIIEACVKGWENVTYEWLSRQISIDIKSVDKKAKVPFTIEDMKYLVKQAYGIDSWILDTVRDAANFCDKEEETKN